MENDKIKPEFQAFLLVIEQICGDISVQERAYFLSCFSLIHLPAKHFFIQANTVQKDIGFVLNGLIRAFYVDDAGNEITIRFSDENDFVTDYPAFIAQQNCKYYFQCLEPTTLITLNYEQTQNGYKKHHGIERFGRLIAEQVLKMQQSRIESFLFETAEQRYLKFIKNSPTLFNRVSLSTLSSYLGIERPSLSRIRKKISLQ
jgi:CRP/FNR family transcriptional regulator, anaerobic regulatory protein